LTRLPALVCHADWSKHARKRWLALATLQASGRYCASAPQRVGPLPILLKGLDAEVGEGPILLGFDFPIGLPRAYARLAKIGDFRSKLKEFDTRFYTVATQQQEICVDQPFYPMRNKECDRQQLLAGLGLAWCDLLRRCDRASETRRAACACSGRLAASRSARLQSPAGGICWHRRSGPASTSRSGRSTAGSKSCWRAIAS
jgi:hypothetical protein